MGNYKVGDKVRIINKRGTSWNHDGLMDKWQGKVMTIRRIGRSGTYWMIEDIGENDGGWSWQEKDFAEKINAQSIHITTNGNTVHAILKDGGKVIKRSKAVCAPSDTFDFETGARIAFDRLCTSLAENSKFSKPQTEDKPAEPINLYCVKSFRSGIRLTKGKVYTVKSGGKSMYYDGGWHIAFDVFNDTLGGVKIVPNYLVPEVKRPAKVGEWIKITRSKEERAVEGGVYQFVEERGGIVFIKHPDGMRYPDGAANIGRSEYVVLDGYKPEPDSPTINIKAAFAEIDKAIKADKCTSCRRERINEAICTPKLDPNQILDRIERLLRQ